MEVKMESFGYNWHGEMVVSHRMFELERETEKIQLLLDAGLYNPGLFERMVGTIEKGLVKIGLHIRKNYNERQRAYQVTTSKYAA
jgi:hypothetical protein